MTNIKKASTHGTSSRPMANKLRSPNTMTGYLKKIILNYLNKRKYKELNRPF